MNNNSWFKKQRPFQGFSGFGGGGLGLSFGGGSDPTIEASGGLIGEYTDAPTGDVYRTHTFTSPGKFVVSSVVGAAPVTQITIIQGIAGTPAFIADVSVNDKLTFIPAFNISPTYPLS